MKKCLAIECSQEIKCMLHYLGTTICLKKRHIKRNRYYCSKGCRWICKQCEQNSYYIGYIYRHYNSTYSYCVCHYLKHFQIIIYYWKGNVVTLFDPITKAKKNITLSKNINTYADSISVGNRIYIIGGYSPTSNEMNEVDFKNNSLIQKKSMLTPKCLHTLCSANDYIYSVGGYNNASISDCEKYSISKDNWKALPTLQTARRLCAAFTFNDTLLYCLYGYNESNTNLDSMEMMSVAEYGKWEYVNVSNMYSPRWGVHGIQISDNEAIVFGGNIDGIECYVFCMMNGVSCKRVGDLAVSSEFYACASPAFDGSYVYDSDYNRRIHIYSIANKKWGIVE